MNPQQAYKLFSQTLTALNSLRALARSSLAIKKALTPKSVKIAAGSPASNYSKIEIIDRVKVEQLKGALINMGFSKDESNRTLQTLTDRGNFNSYPLPDLLKEALTLLHK